MVTSRTHYNIVNGPTKEEMEQSMSGKYAVRRTVVFTLINDLTQKKFESGEIRIIEVSPSGPLGVQLQFKGNVGENDTYRHVTGTYHSTNKTGNIVFEGR